MVSIVLPYFQILEKVYMQLQTFLDDPVYREEHTLHLELVSLFARVGPNAEPKFRDECKYLQTQSVYD